MRELESMGEEEEWDELLWDLGFLYSNG